nr:MAG TPA: hypothetical protein [Caudoviricetes sp.]
MRKSHSYAIRHGCALSVSQVCHAWMNHNETQKHATTRNDTNPARARKNY